MDKIHCNEGKEENILSRKREMMQKKRHTRGLKSNDTLTQTHCTSHHHLHDAKKVVLQMKTP